MRIEGDREMQPYAANINYNNFEAITTITLFFS